MLVAQCIRARGFSIPDPPADGSLWHTDFNLTPQQANAELQVMRDCTAEVMRKQAAASPSP